MARRTLPSISVPIVLASVTAPLAIALLVGWSLIFARNLAQGDDMARNVWLLVLGSIAFLTILGVLIMFAVFLVREIMEVRRQDSFIDSVTHELKSPLASLKLGLQTLGREGLDDQKRELLRDMMLGDVDRLSAFIDDVLQASRLSHGRARVGVDLSPVEVHALTSEIASGVAQRHKLAPERIEVAIDSDLRITTDRAALEVVLRNLIDNAVKYSDAPADVRVEAHKWPDGGLVIEVRDKGIGIPRRELKRIFQRFYRVPEEDVRARKGTGLGLFVVSALVRNLGGRIEASSEGQGRGTSMRVRLPGSLVAPKAA
jgi:signal transduction histidine kinase